MRKSLGVFFIFIFWLTTMSMAFAEPPVEPPKYNGERKRIAVIGGGGAGLVTALLLKGAHDVTLFEKENRFGGDTYTIDIPFGDETVHPDVGAEFFNPAEFPVFFKLLNELQVPTTPFQLTSSFSNSAGRSFMVTPFKEGGNAWSSIFNPNILFDLIRLGSFFKRAHRFVGSIDENQSDKEGITWNQYLAEQNMNPRFVQEFLRPFLAAGWAVPYAEHGTWSAETILRTVLTDMNGVQAPFWREINGGTKTYINAVVARLGEIARKSIEIRSIVYSEEHAAYQIHTDQYGDEYFDYLVMATPAHAFPDLLAQVNYPEVATMREAVGAMRYYTSNVYLHSDESFMPQNPKLWAVTNVRTNAAGTESGMTIHKHSHCPVHDPAHRHVLKTWKLEGEAGPDPTKVFAHITFRHKILDQYFIAAKAAMKEFQGKRGIFITAGHMGGDRHENPIVNAAKVGTILNPDDPLLHNLVGNQPIHKTVQVMH